MMTKLTRLLPLALTATLALTACGNNAGPGATASRTTTPEAAVTTTLKLLRAGDFGALAHSVLPPADYTRMSAEWSRQIAEHGKDDAESEAQFATEMAKINAPDCADKLFQQARPFLAEYQSKYQAQLPMYLGVGQTMAGSAIDQSKELDPTQKQQAKDVLASLAQWVQTTNWGDQDKARSALAVVCDTGRSLGLKTMDDVRKLDFDHMLGKYGVAWQGGVKVLAMYGFDLNAALDSAQVKTVSNDGTHAVVDTTVTLFGKPVTSQTKMTQVDGHWYSQNMLDAMQRDAATAASTAAH